MIRDALLGLSAAAIGTAAGAALGQSPNISPPLLVETVRTLIASSGLNPGTVFAVGTGRYAVSSVDVTASGQTFIVRVTVRPLERRTP